MEVETVAEKEVETEVVVMVAGSVYNQDDNEVLPQGANTLQRLQFDHDMSNMTEYSHNLVHQQLAFLLVNMLLISNLSAYYQNEAILKHQF